jgi:hypothetical protein
LQNDNKAARLKQFKISLKSKPVFDITQETERLVEVEEITDELHALKSVLTHQKTTIEQMNKITKVDNGLWPIETRVLDSHLDRIAQMEESAKKASESVSVINTRLLINSNGFKLYHLIDLKQKQGNFSEAFSARKQTESTAKQAEESAKIGKIVMVLTVVTIIFVSPQNSSFREEEPRN